MTKKKKRAQQTVDLQQIVVEAVVSQGCARCCINNRKKTEYHMTHCVETSQFAENCIGPTVKTAAKIMLRRTLCRQCTIFFGVVIMPCDCGRGRGRCDAAAVAVSQKCFLGVSRLFGSCSRVLDLLSETVLAGRWWQSPTFASGGRCWS